MWFGSWENPSSQLLLLAALWSVAASARPDCRSGVRLKRTLTNFYFKPVSSYPAFDRHRVSWSRLYIGGASCEPGAQLQLLTALLKRLHPYSAPRPKAGLHAWEEPTLPHDTSPIPNLFKISSKYIVRLIFKYFLSPNLVTPKILKP